MLFKKQEVIYDLENKIKDMEKSLSDLENIAKEKDERINYLYKKLKASNIT